MWCKVFQTNSEPNKRQIKDTIEHVPAHMANFLPQTVLKDLTTENYSGVIILLLSSLLMCSIYFFFICYFKIICTLMEIKSQCH